MEAYVFLILRDNLTIATKLSRTGDGSKNETTCRICLQPGTVLPCRTCRVAFHTGCVPENSLSEPDSLSLYCSICVQRGWHLSPPELTPPASPVLGPIQQPQVDRPPATPVSAPSTMPSSNPVGATSISEPTGPSTTPQAPQEDSGNAAQRHTDIPQNSLGVNVNPTDDIVTESSAPKRKRKSRFATLSSEVDESLSVLYRELESITSLKMQIIDLRNESIHQNQMIRLRDNKIAILERDLQQRKSAENELAELRANNSQHESIKTELEALRVKVAALESELQESRNETATAQDLVNDWKGKLAQLLNT